MSRRQYSVGPFTSQRFFDTPLTIGVISDTHMYIGGRRELHPEITRLFKRAEVDLMIHLGDANSRSVLEDIAEIAPLIAVPGNNDDEELQKRMAKRLQPFADQILPNRTLEVTVDGKETLKLGPSNQSGYSSEVRDINFQ